MRLAAKASEDVGEPGAGVHAVELGAFGQGVYAAARRPPSSEPANVQLRLLTAIAWSFCACLSISVQNGPLWRGDDGFVRVVHGKAPPSALTGDEAVRAGGPVNLPGQAAAWSGNSGIIVAGEAEQVIDPVGFAPGHRALAREAGIGTQDDPHPRPRLPNVAYDPLDLLDAAGRGIDVRAPQLGRERMSAKERGVGSAWNRQSACFARDAIDLDVSTLADWVGAVAASLQPLTEAIEAHVRAAARIHADETPVPVLAKGKTREGRLWTIVRDDRPFSGPDPPAAVFFYSPDRSGIHAERFLTGYTGIMQADAFSGFGRLYKADRRPGPIVEAGCWGHARRGFFELAELQKAPIAIESVKRIDALFAIEREINGCSAERRRAVRNERSRPLIEELQSWLRDQRAKLSAKSKIAKAIDYLHKRWPAFTRFRDACPRAGLRPDPWDGLVCLSNNAAERAVRGVALGRRNWTFAGSDEGGRRAAAMYTLIETAKLNGIDPRAWLADVLARLPGRPASRVHELLPWNCQQPEPISVAAWPLQTNPAESTRFSRGRHRMHTVVQRPPQPFDEDA